MAKHQKVEQVELFPCNKVSNSNLLIEAKYRLSAGEQKLIKLVASAIHPEDTEFMTYEFYVKDIIKLLGLKSRGSYGTIEGIVEGIMKKVLTIRNLENGDWIKYHWVSVAVYRHKEGKIYIRIDESIKPFFLQLKSEFTSYKLGNILDLKSGYSIRIYELLKQYQKIGHRTLQISELREYLGIEDEEYKLYANFKNKCIIKAQEELAEKTDISFKFEEIKKGRSVDAIKFIVVENEMRIDFIRRSFNLNNLFPNPTQLKWLNEALKDLSEEEIVLVASSLQSAEQRGLVKNSIVMLLSKPDEIISAIRSGTFYPVKKKPKKTDEYEIYIPTNYEKAVN